MPKRKLLQIGNITSRMADRLEPEFDIIEYFKSENKEKSNRAKDKISYEPSNYLDKSISSIHIYDSIAVIYKNVKSKLVPTSLE